MGSCRPYVSTVQVQQLPIRWEGRPGCTKHYANSYYYISKSKKIFFNYIFRQSSPVHSLLSQLGCARFALKFFSLISEIKRIWIRFICVSLFHYKISLLFFRFFSLIFASNFLLRFALVFFPMPTYDRQQRLLKQLIS